MAATFCIVKISIVLYNTSMKDVIIAFDLYLNELDIKFDSVVIGGGALILMNIVNRSTRDVDCLDPEIETVVKQSSIDFAKKFKQFNLIENWLNNGPITLCQNLPVDWRSRLEIIYQGQSITLRTLGRSDFLKTKIFAYCDRDIDLEDCVALKPTPDEISDAADWVYLQDASELWPARVEHMVSLLKKRLAHE